MLWEAEAGGPRGQDKPELCTVKTQLRETDKGWEEWRGGKRGRPTRWLRETQKNITNYWQNQSRSTHICHRPQTISCVICFYFPLSYYLILYSLCCIDYSFILSNTQISASLRSHHPTEQLIGTDLTNRYLALCHPDISILVLFMCMCVIHVCMVYVCAPIGTHRGQRRML